MKSILKPILLLVIVLVSFTANADKFSQIEDLDNPVCFVIDHDIDNNDLVNLEALELSSDFDLLPLINVFGDTPVNSLDYFDNYEPEPIEHRAGGWTLISSWLLFWWGAFAQKIKKTPTSTPKDSFTQYALDYDGAGTAAPHYLTEDGKTIKLFPADAMTAPEAGAVNTGDAGSDTVITNMRTRIGELEALLVANGLLTEAE